MKLSNRGEQLIKKYEGLRLEAYKCPAGKWTIGYGHTARVKPGMVITRDQAEEFFRNDVRWAQKGLLEELKVPVPQGIWDAMVSLLFNLGKDGCDGSGLLRLLNSKDFVGAKARFLLYNKMTKGGKLVVSQGLKNRRKKEIEELWEAVNH